MPVIKLNGSDTIWACGEDDTVMRAALRAGHGFPYECNVGACGNCRFELVEGQVEHLRADPPGWSERDRQRNRYLGCQARPLSDCVVKLRLSPHYASKSAPRQSDAVLIGTRAITHDIREFRFRTETPADFAPGQYALLDIPEVEGARAYSMANLANEDGVWDFQIRRVADGAATKKLFDGLEVGATVRFDGPYGNAYLRENAERDIICLAGGSGLAPMISIARGVARVPGLARRRLDFIYGGRDAIDICGKDMLQELPGFGETLHYHPVVSTLPAGEDGWNGYRGFVHEIAHQLFADRLATCEVYFAGPPLMGQAVQKMLAELRVPPGQIHFDQFY